MTMSPTPVPRKVPVTILTGFLGAGKTTLLNRILRERHGERIAVIENEFGAAGVDNDLLFDSGSEQIVEMNNGCICCTVRGDLVRILGELRLRREASPAAFDRIIIETTGLADPAPVAQTFFIDDDIAAYYALDAIVTVVDALHAPAQLDQFHEAQEQVAFADRLLISKSDLVSAAEGEQLRRRLSRINPRAHITAVNFGATPLQNLLDIAGFSLDGILDIEPGFLDEDHHEHDDAVQSFVFTSAAPFDPDRLQAFFRATIAAHAKDLMRYKGIVAFQGLAHRVVFQGVHMVMGSDAGRAWEPGEPRPSKLVFIGRSLPETALRDQLEQCLVAGDLDIRTSEAFSKEKVLTAGDGDDSLRSWGK
jgi:G3E family GTPase